MEKQCDNKLAGRKKNINNFDKNFNIRDFLHTEQMNESEIDHCEFWVTANRVIRETKKHNFEEARIEVNKAWDLALFEEWLKVYEDKEVIQYLRYRWPLNAKNMDHNEEVPRNQAGAQNNPSEVKEYLRKEREAGSVIGLFKRNPFGSEAHFSPLDTRPKKDSDELRVILNLSYPHDSGSVNSSINKDTYVQNELMSLKYPSVDDLAKLVCKKGKKCRIFVRDLSKAYQQLYMCPSSIHLLGYWFDDELYFDVTLSMGSRSAAYCCQHTTDAVTYVYNSLGYEDVNYLDDLGAAEEDDKAEEAFDCLGWVLASLGIKESISKAKPPAFVAVFLGILFNTITMMLRITPERLQEIKNLLKEWFEKETASLKEIQSLLGKLNFAASTIRAGRIFVSRLINSLKEFPDKGMHKVSKELKKDLQWWDRFMESFDGISIMPPQFWNFPDEIFSSDAYLISCGGWSNGEAFIAKFPRWLTRRKDISISELELLTVVVALKLWRHNIRNRNVLAHCDNES